MKRISFLLLLISFSFAFSSSRVDLSATRGGYQLKVTIPEYTLNEVDINENDRAGNSISSKFTDLDIKGYTDNCEIGAPEILSKTFEIALEDDNISFNVNIIDADTITLTSKLFPKQYEVEYCNRHSRREVFAYDAELYTNFKNDPTVKVLDMFTFRKQKAATIMVTPVNYDVKTNRLIIIKDMVININMTKPTKVRSSNSSKFDKIMRNKFQNLRSDRGFSVPSTATRQMEDYLIIATSQYKEDPNLKKLIEYRQNMYNVEVVEASSVGTTKDQFRDFIRGKMPSYVLLVGRYSDFPGHTFTFQFQQPTTVKSVAYYVGAQTSNKPNPDIAMGIFFVSSTTDIENVVNKTIKVEENNEDMPNVFVGEGGNEQQMGSLAPDHCDKVVKQMGEQFFVPNGYEHVEVYSVISPKGGKTEVINAVNNGVRFVNYNGHGFVSGWQYGWRSSDLSSLTNTEYFPTVLSCACLTGTYDQNCIAQTFAYGSTGPSVWIGAYESSSMGQHTMNYGFYEAIMEKDITTVGQAYVYGANATTNPDATKSMPPNTSTYQLMQWQYHIFGDPALETIYAVNPEPFISVDNPAANDELIVGTDMDIVWSTNTEGNVTIKLFKGQTEISTIASNETNDKNFTWEIPESIENGDNYVIKITADGITGESEAFTIKQKPSIVLGSTSFDVTINSDETAVEKLNVKNEGEGKLNYKIKLKKGSSNLLINEIFTPYNEFIDGIEIWNRGSECDLKGYTIKWTDNQQTSGEYTFAESYILDEGETMVLADADATGKTIVVDINLAWSCTDDLTEISVSILDPNGKCVDYVKTAGSTDNPPADQWTGAGIPVGSQRLCRKNNEDNNSASDWTSAEGETSINVINTGQSMDGVGESWLTINSDLGTVNNLSDIDINLTFDSKGLALGGEFMDTLVVTHDDPDTESPIYIPCKLTIDITPLTLVSNKVMKFDILKVGNSIKFQIPEKFSGKNVSIDLFNLQGKMVKRLVNGTMKSGIHTISLINETDKNNVASGFYLCRMKATNFTKTINMNVIK